MAMDLFKKMVDAKQPFHITLFNVCFTKLQEQQRNSTASSITSFLRKGASENEKDYSQAQAALSTSACSDRTPDKKYSKTGSSLDSFFQKMSPSKGPSPHKKRSSENFDDLNPKRFRSASSTADESVENRDQTVIGELLPDIRSEIINNESSKQSMSKPLFKTSKMPKDGSECDTELNKSNESKDEDETSTSADTVVSGLSHNKTSVKGELVDKDWQSVTESHHIEPDRHLKDNFVPPDVDPHVFQELPQEIKNELLRNWKSKQEFSFSTSNRANKTQSKKQTLLQYFKKK